MAKVSDRIKDLRDEKDLNKRIWVISKVLIESPMGSMKLIPVILMIKKKQDGYIFHASLDYIIGV